MKPFDLEEKIDVEKLREKKLFVATPMYGGQASGMYTKSMCDLSAFCASHGIDLKQYFLFNESLISRARNYCASEFLRSDATHLMFIDADIGFNYKDVLTLLHICGNEGYDIVTGPYPKKTIAWEKIVKAVKMGYADENPFILEQFVGDYVFNLDTENHKDGFKINELVQVKEAGTGFMMISRESLEKYAEAYPELKTRPDHIRTEHFDGSKPVTAFFDTVIDSQTLRYLSEDYMFCKYARNIGLKVWMCPWMQLRHVGTYTFGGSLAAIAAIQASPTADQTSNRKHYLTNLENGSKKTIPVNVNENRTLSRQQRRAQERENTKKGGIQ